MKCHVVMDSTGDLPDGWAQRYGVHILPVTIVIGRRTYRDRTDLDAATLVHLVRTTGHYPRTSQPSLGDYLAFYRQVARPGETVLSIHVSRHLSGAYDTAQAAARELAAEGIRVVPFDSQGGSIGMGFLARAAAQACAPGYALPEVLTKLRALRERLWMALTLCDLDFARHSGRVHPLAAALASLLRIYPVLEVVHGRLQVVAKVRTPARALRVLVQRAVQRFGRRPLHLAVMHALAPARARALDAQAQAALQVHERIQGGTMSAALTAHLGPGAVGLVAYAAAPNQV